MSKPDVQVKPLTGQALQDALPDLAQLRIEVFRDFPYLYEGDLDYERRYVENFAAHPQAVIVAALDGDKVVGASTAAPLHAEHDEFKQPFVEAGYDVERVFYLAESVLLPGYRGLGLGHAFFEQREAHARGLEGPKGAYTTAAFCAVVRPDDHPAKPEGYRPLDGFWNKRGYTRRPDMIARFAWKDLGDEGETEKPLMFWVKDL